MPQPVRLSLYHLKSCNQYCGFVAAQTFCDLKKYWLVNFDCTACIGMVVGESTKQRDGSEVIVTKDLVIPTK